jgi:hypothetical protein
MHACMHVDVSSLFRLFLCAGWHTKMGRWRESLVHVQQSKEPR